MSTGFQSIEHIVVLMIENRSFDNILGETFEPGAKRSNDFYPSADGNFKIPVPGFTIGGRNFLSASIPTPDPGEMFQFMNQQIFGQREPSPVNTRSPSATFSDGRHPGFSDS